MDFDIDSDIDENDPVEPTEIENEENPTEEKDPDSPDEQSPDSVVEVKEQKETGSLRAVPTLDYFEKTYARSLQNDQKAVNVFRNYESSEKLRRLQSELMYVKDNRVPLQLLIDVVGKKREERFGGYDKWASLMIMWTSQKGR